MANNLTGDFDAVVQVSVDAINGILATLHQNGLNKNASPTFPHSFATRVGATPQALTYEVAQVAGWMQQAGLVSLGGDNGTLKRVLAKAPPGVSQGLGRAIKAAHEAQRELTRLSSASGVAQVQLSTPQVSFSAGSTSEVTAHVEMRANYIPDPGTPALPEPVHGDVEVDFALEQRLGGSARLLEARIPAGANRIRFTAAAESQIQQVLSGNGNLESALQSFDSSAQARFKAMDTDADGLVLRGSIATKPRYQVIDEFTETGDEQGFSALKSWIPGGTIERFIWSWTDNPTPYIPWASTGKFFEDKHRFLLPKPSGVNFTSEICLVVTGRQVYPGTYSGPQLSPIGTEIPVTGGESCSSRNSDPGMVATMPSWWDVVMRPIWEPDPPPESVLEQAIGAHVDVLSTPLAEGETGANTIVQFSDLSGENPFDTLNGPLSTYSGGEIPMALILVLPRGTFARRRAEVESRLGQLDAFSGSVMITEDYENGWSRTFGLNRGSGTFLLNARGELAWGKPGELDAKAFTSALKRNLIAGPQPEPPCMGLRMRTGDRVPDLLIHDLCGHRTALRKLRGRRLLLNFWQSWSMPCIRELRNLSRRQTEAGSNAPMAIAINGGESPERIDAFSRGQELGLVLAQDPGRRIARTFGVTCWPTTLSVTEDGIVDGIQFGVATGRRAPADSLGCRHPGVAG